MAQTLFSNVRILDGSGDQPYPGEVLIQGNRIQAIGRDVFLCPRAKSRNQLVDQLLTLTMLALGRGLQDPGRFVQTTAGHGCSGPLQVE